MITVFGQTAKGRRIVSGLVIVSMLTVTGCATYRPIGRDSAVGGTDLRLDLTERGTLELSALIGPSIVSLDGQVRSVTDTSFKLSLTQVINRTGDAQVWTGEVVSVPMSYVNGFRKRENSRSRTYLLAGAIVVGAIMSGVAFKAGTSGNGKAAEGPVTR